MPLYISLCDFCEHEEPLRRCKAFPNGIPNEVHNGAKDHRLPIKGDHGIQFQIREGFKDDAVVHRMIARELAPLPKPSAEA